MQPGQRLSDLTARILTSMDDVMLRAMPDWVLVQGDTTTVMAASLAAFYHRVKVGHVEAGLRSGDKYRPFPEEINRRIADVLSDLYFAPTTSAQENLLRENVPADRIVVTGNTVIDALLDVAGRVDASPALAIAPQLGNKRLVLVTSHRRENFGEPFRDILQRHTRFCHQIQRNRPHHLSCSLTTRMCKNLPVRCWAMCQTSR